MSDQTEPISPRSGSEIRGSVPGQVFGKLQRLQRAGLQVCQPEWRSRVAQNGARVEIQFPDGRVAEGFYGEGILGTVGYSNLISEEEEGSKKRWRYAEELKRT